MVVLVGPERLAEQAASSDASAAAARANRAEENFRNIPVGSGME
jgi:hypothetical protein